MYYRRKVLLALLQIFDDKLEKISLQKLLFLFTQHQKTKSYHFVPYKFGCYSFQANADLHTMQKYKQVSSYQQYWLKTDTADYVPTLKSKDQHLLKNLKSFYGKLNQKELITQTYLQYPYYAINSTILTDVLSEQDQEKVEKAKPVKQETVLFTIGYEGITLEQYINKLIINDVKMLCDVRRNPLSMKFGFSKNQLKNACQGVGIEYLHIPEVGIASDKRQMLNSQADYDALFQKYRTDTLAHERAKIQEILIILKNNKRIALTCFEANIHQCHRKHLADSIAALPGFDYKLMHI